MRNASSHHHTAGLPTERAASDTSSWVYKTVLPVRFPLRGQANTTAWTPK
jgi:hypothetical protein